MNAERIKELADFLLQTDQKLKLQQRLEALRDALINLTSQPGEATYQTAVVSTMADLSKAVANQLEGQLTPARTEALREIGAGPYFSKAMTESIQVMLAENSVTPAAVRDAVTQLAEKRTAFLENLRKTQAGLLALGVQSEPLSPGEADLGFLLPRDLFKNSLSGFSKELTEIEKIINVFSEVVTGAVEPIELKQLSTTDPLIFLRVHVGVVVAIGATITWLLNTWKQGLEIRSLHDKSKTMGLPEDVLAGFKKHNQEKIDAAIAQHAQGLLEAHPRDEEGRANELRNHLTWAMNSLLAKIERGMTVELRFLPPPAPEPIEQVEGAEPVEAASNPYTELFEISKKLDFPRVAGEPLIPLPKSAPNQP
jgi:hypothetical protein